MSVIAFIVFTLHEIFGTPGIYVNERDSLFLIHLYKNSNSISSIGVYFAIYGVCSLRSFGQIKSKGAVHVMFFKKAVNCELAVPVPNLLGMCELAIFYTLY